MARVVGCVNRTTVYISGVVILSLTLAVIVNNNRRKLVTVTRRMWKKVYGRTLMALTRGPAVMIFGVC